MKKIKKNIVLDECINFLKSDEIKNEIKQIIKPFLEYLFNELSIYLLFFCIFYNFQLSFTFRSFNNINSLY